MSSSAIRFFGVTILGLLAALFSVNSSVSADSCSFTDLGTGGSATVQMHYEVQDDSYDTYSRINGINVYNIYPSPDWNYDTTVTYPSAQTNWFIGNGYPNYWGIATFYTSGGQTGRAGAYFSLTSSGICHTQSAS